MSTSILVLAACPLRRVKFFNCTLIDEPTPRALGQIMYAEDAAIAEDKLIRLDVSFAELAEDFTGRPDVRLREPKPVRQLRQREEAGENRLLPGTRREVQPRRARDCERQ